MSSPGNTGDKTEKATSKRLREARKQGQVPSSRDLTQTITTGVWLILLITVAGYHGTKIAEFTNLCWTVTQLDSAKILSELGRRGTVLLVTLSAIPLAVVASLGVLTDFVQSGPVFSFQPVTPNLAHLNPMQGIQRVFSIRNWFDTTKNLVKTALIVIITGAILIRELDDLVIVPLTDAKIFSQVCQRLLVILSAWITAIFLSVAMADWLFQKYNYQKQLRMSKQDVRQERKNENGDPQLRSQRRRVQRQWANGSTKQAVRNASALVVNPTHIAVALEYKPETTVVPLVTATGEGNLAALMREIAEKEGIPIMRSIPLARRLYHVCEEEEFVPEELFDAVAEVLAWANYVRQKTEDKPGSSHYREADSEFDWMAGKM